MVSSEIRSGGIMSEQELAAWHAPGMVYICEVDANAIRREIAQDLPPYSDFIIEPDTKFYAVCAADGTRVAIAESREAAFAAALQNEMTPVSVH